MPVLRFYHKERQGAATYHQEGGVQNLQDDHTPLRMRLHSARATHAAVRVVRRQEMGRFIGHKAGFTLIELMVVIIILGLLAAIVMPRIVGETDKARYGAALAQMRILEDALKRYKLDNGVFPTTDQGLEALVRRPTSRILPRGWPEGGYLDKQEIPRDPWGNTYVSISPGQHSPDYDIKSFGADGLEGGDGYNADIESWRIS